MLYESRLNGAVEDIGGAIGYTATCTFVEWYGGRQVWIPERPDENSEIAKVIGLANLRRLVDLFGGQALTVPTDYFREVTRRDRIVTMMVQAGNGTRTIAATVGLTERQVQNIRRRLEEAGILETARYAVPERIA